jgi:hypothetical protein
MIQNHPVSCRLGLSDWVAFEMFVLSRVKNGRSKWSAEIDWKLLDGLKRRSWNKGGKI